MTKEDIKHKLLVLTQVSRGKLTEKIIIGYQKEFEKTGKISQRGMNEIETFYRAIKTRN